MPQPQSEVSVHEPIVGPTDLTDRRPDDRSNRLIPIRMKRSAVARKIERVWEFWKRLGEPDLDNSAYRLLVS